MIDFKVIRMPKTYPAYFGVYDRFDEVALTWMHFREPFPGRAKRHAQVQQPGSLDAHGDDAVDNIIEGAPTNPTSGQ